ncbi:MAG: hypothetical protein H6818_08925 [Phycisphaerales bacterium]|nr:hypothetical protein [Phycisphaerales bacterium]MCB9862693.1 hypothetical protein [Phycisphaerales bacterium]
MSSGRIIGAGILGGIIMFFWGWISHMALPLGEMGMDSLPNEGIVLPQLSDSIHERSFYMFPGLDMKNASEAQMEEWTKRYEKGPRGILIFDPTSDITAMSPKMLGTELASNIAAALLGAIVLARVNGTKGTRIYLAMLMGIAGWLSIDVSYWNWYRFPDMYAVAQLLDQGAGWLLSGIGIAMVLGGAKAATAPVAAGVE